MDSRTLVERVMRNLSFQVEAIPIKNKFQNKTTSSKADPMNVTVKVRKKEINEQYNRGFISNNQSEPEKMLQNIRFVSSHDTIVSFDMFMEEEGKKSTPIKNKTKPRKHIFDKLKPGIRLGATTDNDNQPYKLDEHNVNASWVSKSDEKFREYETTHEKTERTWLGQKCKPGGCLDPPFGADTYSYTPVAQDQVVHVPGNTGTINPENRVKDGVSSNDKSTDNNEIKSKDPSISINRTNKVQKSDPVLNIYETNPKINATRPPDDKNKAIKGKIADENKPRINDSTNSFYSPPKGIKRESSNFVQQDPSNRHLNTPNSIKDKPTEYIPIPIPIPIPITAIKNSVPEKRDTASKTTDDINSIGETKNKEIKSLPISQKTEQKPEDILVVPIQVGKELTEDNAEYIASPSPNGNTNKVSPTPKTNSTNPKTMEEGFSKDDDKNQKQNVKDQGTGKSNNLSAMIAKSAEKEVSKTSIASAVDQATIGRGSKGEKREMEKENTRQQIIINEPNEVRNIIEKPNKAQDILKTLVDADNIVQKPHQVQNVIEKPDKVQIIIEKPDEAQNITEIPNTVQNIKQKPDTTQNTIEKPDEVHNTTENHYVTQTPDKTQKIIEKPDKVQNTTGNVDAAQNIIEKPDKAQKIIEKPDELQNTTENRDAVQNIIGKPDKVQNIIEKPDEVQKSRENHNAEQNIIGKPDKVQKMIEKPDEVQNTTESRDAVQTITKKPDKIQKTIEKPDEVQNTRENPDAAQNIIAKPDKVQNMIEKPDEVKKTTENYDAEQNIIGKPSKVQNLIEEPDDVQKTTENHDAVQNITEKPDKVQNVIEKSDDAQNIIKEPDEVPNKDHISQISTQPQAVNNKEMVITPSKEITSPSEDKPQLANFLAETFKPSEDVNTSNRNNNITDGYADKKNSNGTNIVDQQKKEPKQIKEIALEQPSKHIVNYQDGSNTTKSGTKKKVDINMDIQGEDQTGKDNGSSIDRVIPPVQTNIIETETTSPKTSKFKDKTALPEDLATSDLKTVSLNLAFHSYIDNNKGRIFKTVFNETEVDRRPNDSVTLINSQIKASQQENYPELIVPIDSSLNMVIKIENNNSRSHTVSDKPKTMPISNYVQSAQAAKTAIKGKGVGQKVHYPVSQNDIVLDTTLTDIYEQELIPLQQIIRALKADVDVLAGQHISNKTNVVCQNKLPRHNN